METEVLRRLWLHYCAIAAKVISATENSMSTNSGRAYGSQVMDLARSMYEHALEGDRHD